MSLSTTSIRLSNTSRYSVISPICHSWPRVPRHLPTIIRLQSPSSPAIFQPAASFPIRGSIVSMQIPGPTGSFAVGRDPRSSPAAPHHLGSSPRASAAFSPQEGACRGARHFPAGPGNAAVPSLSSGLSLCGATKQGQRGTTLTCHFVLREKTRIA